MDRPVDDRGILDRISTLVEREHQLRSAREAGTVAGPEELEELAAAEVELDRCWDLLRQRRARQEYGEDPAQAQARAESVVEHYLQ